MIHLGACLDRLQDAMRREFIATPSELFSQELGSYDSISKVHVECLLADSLFPQFSTVAIACLKCDEKDQAWLYFPCFVTVLFKSWGGDAGLRGQRNGCQPD